MEITKMVIEGNSQEKEKISKLLELLPEDTIVPKVLEGRAKKGILGEIMVSSIKPFSIRFPKKSGKKRVYFGKAIIPHAEFKYKGTKYSFYSNLSR